MRLTRSSVRGQTRRVFSLASACCAVVASLCLATVPASANPKYAGYVYDVNAGKALYSEHATDRRFPASLTKIMTVYVMFEEIEAGRMKFGTRMSVSKHAAARPPSKIGFKPGQSIAVRDAIKALVTKSANDVAAIVGEHISGSESAFAERMTRTARRLGMSKTTFRNASGLPNPGQVTTAQDMAKLGIAIQRDFPQYYGVFSTRSFKFGKRSFRNHNRLLGTVEGVDGIKTGYIRASGFNLVTSVRHDGKHLVAVVMGGRTGASRNAQMKSLIARALPKAKRGKTMPVYAFNDQDPPPLPAMKPVMTALYAARFKAAAKSDDDPIGAQLLAFAAQARGSVSVAEPAAADDPNTLTAVIAQARAAGLDGPAEVEPAQIARAAQTAAAQRGDRRAAAQARQILAPSQPPAGISPVLLASAPYTSETGATSGVTLLAPKTLAAPAAQPAQRFAAAFDTFAQAGGARLTPEAVHVAAARQLRSRSDGSARPVPSDVTGAMRRPEAAKARTEPRGAPSGQRASAAQDLAPRAEGWQIQLGAVGSQQEAMALLSDAASDVPAVVEKKRVAAPVETSKGTLYRARFAGFASQQAAVAACKRFANHNRPCWATSM